MCCQGSFIGEGKGCRRNGEGQGFDKGAGVMGGGRGVSGVFPELFQGLGKDEIGLQRHGGGQACDRVAHYCYNHREEASK
jgi:hypothetical protein